MIEFSHRENIDKVPGGTGSYDEVLRKLGDEGWGDVLPLPHA
jgi:hypothetical protein